VYFKENAIFNYFEREVTVHLNIFLHEVTVHFFFLFYWHKLINRIWL